MVRRGRGGVPARGRGVPVLRVRAVRRLPRAERARRRGSPGLRMRTHPKQEEADRHGRPLRAARRRRGHQVGLCTAMQENMWAWLRDSPPGACLIHAT